LSKIILTFTLLFFSQNTLAQENPSDPQEVVVFQVTNEFKDRLQNLTHTFSTQGTDAVANEIAADLQNPKKLAAWQSFVQSTEVQVLNVQAHPNEAAAIRFMNQRFQKMGIKNLRFEGAFDDKLSDPTSLPEEKIKNKKWLRYLAGPGVAMAATAIGMSNTTAASTSDYMLLVVPAVGVGVTTVLLELQFAWPYLNNKFWKHVWKFGGPVMGRVTNIFVNFMYGMSLYGAGLGASYIPVLFGGEPIPYAHLAFVDAVTAAAIGGVTFHLSMGQFQTDISNEEERGVISGEKRYSLETTGVVVNNSARVLDWVVPAGFGAYAQGAFFILKTLPQLIKTNVATDMADRNVHRTLYGEESLPKTRFERCAEILGSLQLINLPTLRK
jgi:hypothetical protein